MVSNGNLYNLSTNINSMSSNNEIQRSSHENQLLNELQSTVKSRWNEFDNALPTGASFKSEYQSMKNAYD